MNKAVQPDNAEQRQKQSGKQTLTQTTHIRSPWGLSKIRPSL